MMKRVTICVAGILLCLANLLAPDAVCLAPGCAISASFSILGLSLWHFGLAGWILLLALAGKAPLFGKAANVVLALDIPLMLFMGFGAVCPMCVMEGCLLLMAASCRLLERIWLGCAVLACGALFASLPPASLPSQGREPAVWFSMECPACRKAVAEYPEARLIPIGDGWKDAERAARMEILLERDIPPMAAMTDRNAEVPLPAKIFWGCALLWNRVKFISRGYGTVPVIILSGLPDGSSCGNGSCGEEDGWDIDAWLMEKRLPF